MPAGSKKKRPPKYQPPPGSTGLKATTPSLTSKTYLVRKVGQDENAGGEVLKAGPTLLTSSADRFKAITKTPIVQSATPRKVRPTEPPELGLVCFLCGERVPVEGMAAHKRSAHGETASPAKYKRRLGKFKFDGFVQGGLPSLGKRSK